jgi:O-antigen/teichoic acid export membrane protein
MSARAVTIEGLSASRYGRIVHAVWSGGAVRVLGSLLTLISLPLAVRYLGADRYGVWATITTTAVWINLLDFGIANTLTNAISRAYAHDDKVAAARSFTNALVLTTGLSALVGAVFVLIIPRVNWVTLFNAGASVSAAEIKQTVAVAAALMLLGLPCNLGSKLLAGYQELHRNNYALSVGAVASLCGLAVGIALHVSMPLLLLMSAGCLPLASLATLLFVVALDKPWLSPRLCFIDRSCLASLLNSGSSFFLIQVAAVVVFSSDNLVVSHYLGAAEVTPYSVTWRLAGLTSLAQSLIFPAMWPAYSEAYAKGDHSWIRRTFVASMKATTALNLFCVIALVVFGRSAIRLWAGPAAVPHFSLLLAMGIWALISGFMSVESCLLAALNRVRGQAMLSIVAAALNLALSLVLVRRIGSLGVIAGTIASYLMVLVVPQTIIVRRVWRRALKVNTCGSDGSKDQFAGAEAHSLVRVSGTTEQAREKSERNAYAAG